ncbi:MAG: exo-beta-N-acetylmuramidase NamZ domain-containing protein, partial [Candidatus Acidiferrales bacterium]
MFRNRFLPALLFIATFTIAFAAAPRKPAAVVPQQPSAHLQTGIDVLEQQNFAPLRGKRVGLITNQTGVDSQGRRTIDVLARADGVQLVALFSP